MSRVGGPCGRYVDADGIHRKEMEWELQAAETEEQRAKREARLRTPSLRTCLRTPLPQSRAIQRVFIARTPRAYLGNRPSLVSWA